MLCHREHIHGNGFFKLKHAVRRKQLHIPCKRCRIARNTHDSLRRRSQKRVYDLFVHALSGRVDDYAVEFLLFVDSSVDFGGVACVKFGFVRKTVGFGVFIRVPDRVFDDLDARYEGAFFRGGEGDGACAAVDVGDVVGFPKVCKFKRGFIERFGLLVIDLEE